MNNSLFYNHVNVNDKNREVIQKITDYTRENNNEQIYLLTAPLGKKYTYDYEDNALVILSPRHKIIFLDLDNNTDTFKDFIEDFLEDLSSISDKFNYKQYIGRPRTWKEELIFSKAFTNDNIEDILNENMLDSTLKRKSELLISLLIGSINDIEKIGVNVPETLLEKVKKNIILFDGDQTRFIYQNYHNKTVSIQGLSGTGKTELLLHKLKELYLQDDDSKIFFTCHNIALANTLKERIPSFFNFMKVEKQIEWNDRLWMDRAWGSQRDKNSGLYSYLCNFYNIPFLRFNYKIGYNDIFSQVLEYINAIDDDEFEFAFDYIMIDERQDFPKVFFDLCEKITRRKVYVAGDIFQDIFDSIQEEELEVDVILNRCYRTDPRTLMFAHAIGMGLFEDKKFNWLTDEQWKAIGYKIKRDGRTIDLTRDSIRRFDELELEDIESIVLQEYGEVSQVVDILKKIQNENPTVIPDDIAIIILDDNKSIYSYIDNLGYEISEQLGWEINRAYDTKRKELNTLFISNRNNVKGLEFPFVICITAKVLDNYKYRNSLYTMLTRSFIQSYLLVKNSQGLDVQVDGLELINSNRLIRTIEPTTQEKDDIHNTIVKLQEESSMSYEEFLNRIFDELGIEIECRHKLKNGLITFEIEKFNTEQTRHYIEQNRQLCK